MVGLKTEISKCITVRELVGVHMVIKNIKSYLCSFPANVAERHSKLNTT